MGKPSWSRRWRPAALLRPKVGDRWNATSVYWLTFDDGGAQIGARVAAAAAAAAGQAYERGVWRSNKQYVSEYAGFDDDHWYNASLTASGTMTQSFPEASANDLKCAA